MSTCKGGRSILLENLQDLPVGQPEALISSELLRSSAVIRTAPDDDGGQRTTLEALSEAVSVEPELLLSAVVDPADEWLASPDSADPPPPPVDDRPSEAAQTAIR